MAASTVQRAVPAYGCARSAQRKAFPELFVSVAGKSCTAVEEGRENETGPFKISLEVIPQNSNAAKRAAKMAQVQELCAFTGASEEQARALLAACGWSTEAAADRFFSTGMAGVPMVAPLSPARPPVNAAKIDAMFDTYCDAYEGTLDPPTLPSHFSFPNGLH